MNKKTIFTIATVLCCKFALAQGGEFFTNYNRVIAPNKTTYFEGKKFINPLWNNAFTVGYQYYFKDRLPLALRLSGSYITAANFETNNANIVNYAKQNNFIYEFFTTNKKAAGYALMGGVQYNLPTKSKLSFSTILDLGMALGNSSEISYFKGTPTTPTLVKTVSTSQSQFIYKPQIMMRYLAFKNIFLNTNIGYSNVTGFTAGGGVVITGTAKQKPKDKEVKEVKKPYCPFCHSFSHKFQPPIPPHHQ